MKKIKFYTFSHKRPDFLKIQNDSMRKFIKDMDFELIVLNNAVFDNDLGELAKEVRVSCQKNNLGVINIEKDKDLIKDLESISEEKIFDSRNGYYNNVPLACGYSLCWAWYNVISKENGPISIIDSDMFFVGESMLSECYENDVCFIPQYRQGLSTSYIWNGIVFINLDTLINPKELNWFCGSVNKISVDVGGQTVKYLEKYKEKIKISEIVTKHITVDSECNFNPVNYEKITIPGNNIPTIIHYRGGSNWNQMSDEYHVKKTEWIKNKIYGK